MEVMKRCSRLMPLQAGRAGRAGGTPPLVQPKHAVSSGSNLAARRRRAGSWWQPGAGMLAQGNVV